MFTSRMAAGVRRAGGAALAVVACLVAACGGSTPSAGASPAYSPTIQPAAFTDTITNPYFPLGAATRVYDGSKDGAPLHIEMSVLPERKTVMGIRTVVVHDAVFLAGKLQENTFDWYAQDANGSVWYFGEDTKELDPNGRILSTAGTWTAGAHGAQPGIVMAAHPAVGRTYQQEYAKGVAEDRIRVLRDDDHVATPAGAYTRVVEIEDTNPLEPTLLERKWFAPGVGFIASDMVRGGAEHVALSRLA